MRLRRTSIRRRVFLLVLFPLLATIAIYSFAVAGQYRTAVGLANAGKVSGATIRPMSAALIALSSERSAAASYLVAPSSQTLTALRTQQASTDKAARVVLGVSRSGPVTANASALEKRDAAKFLSDLSALQALRGSVANRSIGSTAAINSYSAIMADGVGVAEQAIQETFISQSLATTARAEVKLYEAAMLAAEENDLYSADTATGGMPAADQIEFAQLAGLRSFLVADAVPQLDGEASGLMRAYVPASLSEALTSQEQLIIGSRPGAVKPPVPLSTWQQTAGGYARNLVVVLTKSPNWIQSQVVSSARSALTTLILAASLGLLAVLISIVVSLIMGRRLVQRLSALRQAALTLAHDRLPNVMNRLRNGESVHVDAEAPPAAASADEIDQVRQAFTVMHRAAVQAAVDEANLRRGISDVFRNLARRNQALLHRQLGLLDGMERRAEEPEQLEDLFRIDHLTTRMRRHAEGLIILSGDSPGRSWSQPVKFIDVLRAAVAEVEDYTRVQVDVRTRAALAGHAVADVVHMLAELVENAAVYSPPNTTVRIQGEIVGRGFAVEIEDRGLGLSDEQRAEINHNLTELPAFDLAESDRLGLFITGRLAHRHDIKVTLRPSPYGGTTAIVIIPTNLVVPDDSEAQPLAMASRQLETVGHGGNGHRHIGTGARTESWAPQLSAESPEPDESGWFTRPSREYGGNGSEESQAGGNGPSAADGPSATDSPPNGGLPVRVRQASLAPQLRDGDPATGDGPAFDDPPASADEVRDTMSALQRGWELGRDATGEPPTSPDISSLGG